jgi:hypothetical protein
LIESVVLAPEPDLPDCLRNRKCVEELIHETLAFGEAVREMPTCDPVFPKSEWQLIYA